MKIAAGTAVAAAMCLGICTLLVAAAPADASPAEAPARPSATDEATPMSMETAPREPFIAAPATEPIPVYGVRDEGGELQIEV